jgi:ribosomal protein S18 acetylase RimI-like enzyme
MRLKFSVRSAAAGDTERIAALGVQVWLHTYATKGISQEIAMYVLEEFTAAKMSVLLTNDPVFVLVAEVEGNVVGYAALRIGAVCPSNPKVQVELSTLYVQEHFARQGLGSNLLGRAEEVARQRIDSALWLKVNAANLPAIAFYSSHGYTKVGTACFDLGSASHENYVFIGRNA